jgi:hypothetical protein
VGSFFPAVGMKLLGFDPLPTKVGESSRGGDSVEVVGSPGAVFDATLCLQVVGISFEGNVKDFLDVMA